MSTREGQMWTFLRPKLNGAGLMTERLTDRLVEARPDVLWGCADGLTGLTELKAPKPRQSTLGLRSGQAAWLWRWRRGGGAASILARFPDDRWLLWIPSAEVSWVRQIELPFHGRGFPIPDYTWFPWPGPAMLIAALRSSCAQASPWRQWASGWALGSG